MSPEHREILNVRRLPYAVNPQQVAGLTGLFDHEIPIIAGARFITPLGDPAQQDKKLYLTADVIRFAENPVKMSKAVKAIKAYWRRKNQSRRSGNGTARNALNPEYSSNGCGPNHPSR